MAPLLLSSHGPVRSQRQYDMMEVEEPRKPRVNSRARATAEIDVIPPEVFAIGGGFHRQKTNNGTKNVRRRKIEEKKDERPTLPRRIDSRPFPKVIWFHMKNRNRKFDEGVDGIIWNNGEHKRENEEIAITTYFAQRSIEESDHGTLPVKKLEFPSPHSFSNRALSEITLNASQHPEPKDIVLGPRSRHRNRVLRTPISPKRRLIPSVLRQWYPDFDLSESSGRDKPASRATLSRQASDDKESMSSTGDYDGFEEDSYGLNEGERDATNKSTRSQLPQLSPLVEEENSEEESGPFKKRRSFLLFSWPKRKISSTFDSEKRLDQASKKKRGKKFHVPFFKRMSIRGISASSTKLRDGAEVASA